MLFFISGGPRHDRQYVHKGEEATERAGGALEVPGGGVQPYQGGLAHHMGNRGRGELSCHPVTLKYFFKFLA